MQAMERMNELENSRSPTPTTSLSAAADQRRSSAEASATNNRAYPYRPIIRDVNFHDRGGQRRLSLSFNDVRYLR